MTGLLFGQRVAKDHPQIEAVGTFDELNVALGAAKLLLTDAATRELLGRVQQGLVALMGELACAESDLEKYAASKFAKVGGEDLDRLDRAIAQSEAQGLKFDGWAVPGVNPLASALDQARVAARRAERRLTALPARGRTVRPLLRQFINRLSDLLWLMARDAEK